MCVCRVFALSQYLCTASGQRTRHLVTFPEVSLLAEKYFFDKQKQSGFKQPDCFLINFSCQINFYFFNTFLHQVRLLQLGHFKYRVVPLCIALSACV